MDPSYKAAEDYLKLFMPSSLLNSIGRIIVFLSGSLSAVCVALAAMNDSILLHVKIGNWNLVWYLGILGVVYSGGKGLLPNGTVEKSHQNLFSQMDDALGVIATYTHYYPDFWRNRGWDHIIRNELTNLFQYKVQLFAMEVLSILVAPIILCYNFPNCAENICAFIRSVKIDVPGAGDHCGFATFDFDLFEDGDWEGEADNHYGDHQVPRRGSNPPTNLNSLNSNRAAIYNKLISEQKRPKAMHGKMEKSFFNFKAVNPLWKCLSENAIRLVDRIEAYQKQQEQEALALTRERQLHMAAAVLELNRLQSKEPQTDQVLHSDNINEGYIQGIASQGGDESSSDNVHDEYSRKHGESSQLHINQASHLAFTPNPSLLSLGISDENALNKSIFDAGASLLNASNIGHSIPSMSYLRQSPVGMEDDPVQRQYMLLDRYHDEMVIKSQSRQSLNGNNTV
jgi:autophagy-related protein 9